MIAGAMRKRPTKEEALKAMATAVAACVPRIDGRHLRKALVQEGLDIVATIDGMTKNDEHVVMHVWGSTTTTTTTTSRTAKQVRATLIMTFLAKLPSRGRKPLALTTSHQTSHKPPQAHPGHLLE